MTAIHQFIPSYASRDAIGEHTRQVQRSLNELGIESHVYAGEVRDLPRGAARDYRSFHPAANDQTFLLYQMSIGSPVADFVGERPERKIINYHNITPAQLFTPWEPHVGVELEAGRRQLAALAPKTELGIAVSSYNERELHDAGYRSTTVAPLLIDLGVFDRAPDRETLRRLETHKRGGGTDWLFVGRVAPNKAQHDLVRAFAVYRKIHDPLARLHLVGGHSAVYAHSLRGLVEDLDLGDSVELPGSVSAGALAAYYRTADVFVCASDHEGFCVPLLEAMHHQVPIVAYGAAAIPDTLSGGSGLLLTDKQPATFATAVHRVCTDEQLRRSLIAGGQARLETLSLDRTRARFAEVITELLA